jgi:hypothetical protein
MISRGSHRAAKAVLSLFDGDDYEVDQIVWTNDQLARHAAFSLFSEQVLAQAGGGLWGRLGIRAYAARGKNMHD